MSEVGWYESEIRIPQAPKIDAKVEAFASNIEKNPSFQILKQAIEMVSQEHEGTLGDAVTDYHGNKTECDLAVITPEFQRGIGVKIDRNTGKLTFHYDPYGGYNEVAKTITAEITQNYISIASIRALKSLGYNVQEEPAKQRSVVLMGVM